MGQHITGAASNEIVSTAVKVDITADNVQFCPRGCRPDAHVAGGIDGIIGVEAVQPRGSIDLRLPCNEKQ